MKILTLIVPATTTTASTAGIDRSGKDVFRNDPQEQKEERRVLEELSNEVAAGHEQAGTSKKKNNSLLKLRIVESSDQELKANQQRILQRARNGRNATTSSSRFSCLQLTSSLALGLESLFQCMAQQHCFVTLELEQRKTPNGQPNVDNSTTVDHHFLRLLYEMFQVATRLGILHTIVLSTSSFAREQAGHLFCECCHFFFFGITESACCCITDSACCSSYCCLNQVQCLELELRMQRRRTETVSIHKAKREKNELGKTSSPPTDKRNDASTKHTTATTMEHMRMILEKCANITDLKLYLYQPYSNNSHNASSSLCEMGGPLSVLTRVSSLRRLHIYAAQQTRTSMHGLFQDVAPLLLSTFTKKTTKTCGPSLTNLHISRSQSPSSSSDDSLSSTCNNDNLVDPTLLLLPPNNQGNYNTTLRRLTLSGLQLTTNQADQVLAIVAQRYKRLQVVDLSVNDIQSMEFPQFAATQSRSLEQVQLYLTPCCGYYDNYHLDSKQQQRQKVNKNAALVNHLYTILQRHERLELLGTHQWMSRLLMSSRPSSSRPLSIISLDDYCNDKISRLLQFRRDWNRFTKDRIFQTLLEMENHRQEPSPSSWSSSLPMWQLALARLGQNIILAPDNSSVAYTMAHEDNDDDETQRRGREREASILFSFLKESLPQLV